MSKRRLHYVLTFLGFLFFSCLHAIYNPFAEDADRLAHEGYALLKKGDKKEGIKLLEMSLAINPVQDFTHYNLGRAYFELGDTKKAAAKFFEELKREKEIMGEFWKVKWNDVLKDKEILKILKPKTFEEYLSLGIVFCKLGKGKEALIFLEEAGKINPISSQLNYNMGEYYHQNACTRTDLYKSSLTNAQFTENRLKAIHYYKKALEFGYSKYPPPYSGNKLRSVIARLYDDIENAEKSLEYALKAIREGHWSEAQDAEHFILRQEFGNDSIKKKFTHDHLEAKVAVAKDSRIDNQQGKDASHYHSRGLEYFKAGHYEAAIAMWKKEIEAGPKNPSWAYFDIGLCYAKLKKYKKSIPYHKKAIELKLPSVRGHHELAATYYYLDDIEKAKEFVLDGMKSFPYSDETLEMVKTYSYYDSIIPSDKIKEFQTQYEKHKKQIEEKTKQIEEQTQNPIQEPFYLKHINEIILIFLALVLCFLFYFKPWYFYYIYAGDRHFMADKYSDAVALYEKLFEFRKGTFVPYKKLKIAYLKLGRKDGIAIHVFEKFYKENPEDREVITALANAYANKEK